MTPVAALSHERLLQLVHYDPDTGVFTRLVRSRLPVGSKVGSRGYRGYTTLRLDGVSYRANRVAWFYMRGEWPAGVVDHFSGDRADNRWNNLRDVDKAINAQNRRCAHAGSAVGLLGVFRDGDRFRSRIVVRGVIHGLGSFDTAEQAHSAYLAAKRRLHEGCTL